MVRLLIVSSIRLFREGLVQILGRIDSVTVVGQESSREMALTCLRDTTPDVVLLDMSTPDAHALARQMRGLAPGTQVVGLGIEESEAEVLACAEAGIVAYISREGSLNELVAAVGSVVRGEFICTPRIAGSLVRRVAVLAAERTRSVRAQPLTTREREIADLLEEQLSNKQIALRLGIEVATVKNHVHNLLEKLNVHRRAEAAQLVERSPDFHRVGQLDRASGSARFRTRP